jgi:EAL domain-containing protein (putative c-di-GMP-specific phosphodiesterase class I)
MRTHWLSGLNILQPSWLCLTIDPAVITAETGRIMDEAGFSPLDATPNRYIKHTKEIWCKEWPAVAARLKDHGLAPHIAVSIMVSETPPSADEIDLQPRSVDEVCELCGQMWLFDVIEENRLICHFQPVVDAQGKIFGYESLVRATREDGGLINGGEIFYASKVLRVEHLIDRYLHELAIKCYINANLSGFLFINLVPGFIQRPEFYFGGLAEAAKKYGMNAKNIALDCTNSENPRDILQLRTITQYCRSQGYLVSLDDIESPQTARRILNEMQPDFIKIDMQLVQKAAEQPAMKIIRELVDITRNTSCMLIAEGVETESILELLKQQEIGLFQGYLFSSLIIKTADADSQNSSNITANSQQNRA